MHNNKIKTGFQVDRNKLIGHIELDTNYNYRNYYLDDDSERINNVTCKMISLKYVDNIGFYDTNFIAMVDSE